MFRNIPYLYLIRGKIVFRAHFKVDGEEKFIWKPIGRPDEFSDQELRQIVEKLINEYNIPLSHKKKQKSSSSPPHPNQNKHYTQDNRDGNRDSKKTNPSNTKKCIRENLDSLSSLGELFTTFLNWYSQTRRPSSARRHSISAKLLINFFGSDFPVRNLTLGHVEQYKVWRLSQKVDPITINKELRFLATAINRAVEFKWIKDHELYRKPILIRGIKKERIRFLTDKEEKALLNSIKDPLLKDIVLFALNTGLRKGEILNLEWSDIDFNINCIILSPSKTKNKRKHVVPLNSIALEVLKRRMLYKTENCPFVFHRKGNKIKCIKEGFKHALKRAGIEDFRFHDLRHTFASRLVQNGVDLYVVKELLNHSDVVTTQKYAHLKLDNMRKAVDLLVSLEETK